MKRRVFVHLVYVLAIAVVLPASLGNAQEQIFLNSDETAQGAQSGELVNETSSLWFVELKSKPAVEGTSKKALGKEKKAFRAAARSANLKFKERFAFDTLWNGLSIEIDPADLGKLNRIPGVAAIYPVETISAPDPGTGATPDLFTAITMTGADIAQNELGYTGAGVKVAVMDTGIDYDHPDLGGCFGPGCRVAYGWDLVGDDYNNDSTSPTYNPVPVPDDDPDDCQGHGTHVSGIVGADGVVTGVAPGVTFGAYRVFGCEGSTSADIMIAAMEMALADDMDILNMSIGSSFQWPQYPTAAAADRLVNKGMVVVASIGNSGTSGTYAAGAPGVGKKVIGTASFDNVETLSPYFEVAGQMIGYNGMSYAAPAPTSGTEEIVYIGLACNGYPLDADPTGKVALISRGECSFREKALNAQAAGATAAVIHNSAPGNFNGTLGAPYVDYAVVSISLEDGMFIRGQAAPTMMTWTDQLGSFPSPTGGLISGFSSYGLAPDLSVKPDIGAPGGNIYSTIPLEQGGYGIKGGTSMASPHVAGAAALLLEAKPKTNSQVMRTILQNSADPANWSLAPGYGLLDHVHRQGAGMVDIDDAILATTKIEPGKIAVGEGEAGPQNFALKVENNGYVAVTYDLSYVSSVATTGTWADDLGFWLSDEYVDLGAPSVTVNAGGTATVNATIYPPTGPDLGTYGGYIVFTPQGGGQTYRVPYAGFIGDYQALPVLDANPYGLPWLLDSAGGNNVYTMDGGDIPEFWVNLGHQVRKLRMEVFDANSGKAWHRAYDFGYVGRNSNYNNIFSYPWDGTTFSGKKERVVPDGDYVVVISVQKALGDDNNPDHWEYWTSPVITIDRP